MLWKNLHHLVNKAKESSTHVNSYSFLDPEGFCQLTRKEFMTWRLEHSSQQANLLVKIQPLCPSTLSLQKEQ